MFFLDMFVFVTSLFLDYTGYTKSASTMYKKTTLYSMRKGYTKVMRLPKAVKSTPIKSMQTRVVAIAYVVILVVLAFAQLYSFEDFFGVFDAYRLGGATLSAFLGSLIVFIEVFAIPALLSMALSPLMRVVSLSFAIVAPMFWLILVGHAVLNDLTINSGLLGTVKDVPTGMVSLFGCLVLYAFAIYVVYRMTIVQRRHAKR